MLTWQVFFLPSGTQLNTTAVYDNIMEWQCIYCMESWILVGDQNHFTDIIMCSSHNTWITNSCTTYITMLIITKWWLVTVPWYPWAAAVHTWSHDQPHPFCTACSQCNNCWDDPQLGYHGNSTIERSHTMTSHRHTHLQDVLIQILVYKQSDSDLPPPCSVPPLHLYDLTQPVGVLYVM